MSKAKLLVVFSSVLLGVLTAVTSDCSSTQKQVETQVAVKVADDVCQVALNQEGVDPDWVKIICSTGSNLIPVILPKEEWHAIQMRTSGSLPDAGPGMRKAPPVGDLRR